MQILPQLEIGVKYEMLETMAGQGHTIGGKFEQLRSIIDLVHDKSRIGVCLDTCHIFAAGYDIRTVDTYKKTMDEFDRIIGIKYLKAVHLNDSKGDLGSHLDRHENIGKGKIGRKAFELLINDQRMNNIPIVLETPNGDEYENEIELLRSFVNR